MTDHNKVVPYEESGEGKKEQVAQMFDNIAPRYDLLNRVISLGIDKSWRNKAVNLLKPIRPRQILDVATGTGDFAIEALKLQPDQIIGVDISREMLEIGKKKMIAKAVDHRVSMQYGDAENLHFPDRFFDAITVAFGVRNFENLEKGLLELYRVLRPGGMLVILELTQPNKFPFKQAHAFHTKHVLPFVGKMVSKDDHAYTYLPESIKAFPEGRKFLDILENTGFKSTQCIPLTFGVCSIYTGRKWAD